MYYKLILINFTLLFSFQAHSKKTLLHCLAKEELIIHKNKINGPLYLLNQDLINRLASNPFTKFKPDYLRKVCDDRDFSPSLQFVRFVLMNGTQPFNLKGLNAFQIQNIKGLANEVPHLFFAFLSRIQAMAHQAGCLKKHIPALKYFYERYKYLETDYGMNKLLDNKPKINSIFIKLKALDKILKNCQKRPNQKKQK